MRHSPIPNPWLAAAGRRAGLKKAVAPSRRPLRRRLGSPAPRQAWLLTAQQCSSVSPIPSLGMPPYHQAPSC